ncbi:TrbI/VirB10 family protein [Sphingomonas sp.]|jgi:type IV secretion system protein VirB10|uniref:TrbI/VirB10 family protein n=1 Tax=Sphingomonas sp. TaxID=28214 RepID=UPI002E353801|nr:TrbI/VirB10 family protein [Sphingomonas sp.]HEX4695304.1 TrbI/VirB10 family protein [Sphingomonas sp.]
MIATGDDPRPAAEHSARPIVARERRGISNWMIAAGILLAALILFLILDSRRRQLSAPVTNPRFADTGARTPAAPLYIPPEPVPTPTPLPIVVASPPPPPAPPPQPRIVYVQPPQPPQVVAPPSPPPRTSNSPVLVIDNTAPEGDVAGGANVATDVAGNPTGATPGAAGASGAATGGRARASVLRNRSTTVAQGTLIPAVLETALDSTRPGPARALVTRDVRGFDGSKVLIPRGSRLIGEYKADLQPGQNRALVVWTRLVRPDGATIAIGSPAADPLGRVGIKGSVNSHFLERFASAILNSTLNIGVGLASRLGSGNSVAVLALPGTLGGAATPLNGPDQVQRSLRVKQGVSISVFVARDLDFTSVETKR